MKKKKETGRDSAFVNDQPKRLQILGSLLDLGPYLRYLSVLGAVSSTFYSMLVLGNILYRMGEEAKIVHVNSIAVANLTSGPLEKVRGTNLRFCNFLLFLLRIRKMFII